MNPNRVIWEGWTAQDFIDALKDDAERLVKAGKKPSGRKELKKWCMENQPYYKKYIPEVVDYFAKKYEIKSK